MKSLNCSLYFVGLVFALLPVSNASAVSCHYSFTCTCLSGLVANQTCEYYYVAKKEGDDKDECYANLMPEDVDKRLRTFCSGINVKEVKSCSYKEGSRGGVKYE